MKQWCKKLWVRLTAPIHRRRQQRAAQDAAKTARAALLEEMEECRRQLQAADMRFNLASEPQQIESCIYHYRALQAQYDCLVRRARAASATAVHS